MGFGGYGSQNVDWNHCGYGYDNGYSNSPDDGWGLCHSYDPTGTSGVRAGSFSNPSDVLMFGEPIFPTAGWTGAVGGCEVFGWIGGNWEYRHHGGANAVFCDGHAQWYPQAALQHTQYFYQGGPGLDPYFPNGSPNGVGWPFKRK